MLVAIAIPVFTRQLEKSREATDLANVRSAYADLVTAYLSEGKAQSATVTARQTIPGWQSNKAGQESNSAYIGTDITLTSGSGTNQIGVPPKTDSYTISINDSGDITVN